MGITENGSNQLEGFDIDTQTSQITIGDCYENTNLIQLTLTNNTENTAKVRLSLILTCGAKKEALLAGKDAGLAAKYMTTDDNAERDLRRQASTEDNILTLRTKDFGVAIKPGDALRVTLKYFKSETPPGSASIGIVLEVKEENIFKASKEVCIKIDKVVDSSSAKIHYFNVAPDYILHAGQSKVNVSFFSTQYRKLVLYRNNQQVKSWPYNDEPEIDGAIVGSFTDTPSITSTYRLEGTPKYSSDQAIKYRVVQVISPGWNQLELEQGYPTQLFVNDDFNGSSDEDGKPVKKLYGIFVKNGKAKLYSSVTGIDDWEEAENGDIPSGMETSPGVAYQNKLWLIGGSCVDSNKPGNQVFCYGKVEDKEENEYKWIEKSSFSKSMPSRMGHVCSVFKEKLLVMGGYSSETGALNDIWQLDKGADSWKCPEPDIKDNIWKGRLNPSVAAFHGGLYLYGGKEKPQSDVYSDMWLSSDGVKWEKIEGKKYEILPTPGDPLGSTLVTCPSVSLTNGSINERLLLLGSFRRNGKEGSRIASYIFERYHSSELWEENPVFNGWQQFQGSNFYMQAVAFNGFLFLWSLGQDLSNSASLKLNVLVP